MQVCDDKQMKASSAERKKLPNSYFKGTCFINSYSLLKRLTSAKILKN